MIIPVKSSCVGLFVKMLSISVADSQCGSGLG